MQKLQLKDLLSSLEDPQAPTAQVSKATEEFVAAPSRKVQSLPLRQQLKIQRESTYRNTQAQMDKWVGIVKHNREKETLNLTHKDKDNAANISFLPSKPISTLHKKIEQQLHSMELSSQKAVMKKEEEALAKLSKQEAKQRLQEARRQRTAQFNQEIKNRRIAKIKSKLYHRIKKRQKNREEAKRVEELEGEEKREHMEKQRKRYIEERISLRHRSKNNHIKTLLRFGKHSKESVQNALKQVNAIRHQQLEKNNQDYQDLSQELDQENYRDGVQLLQQEIDEMEQQQPPRQGIESMKFMQVGREKQIARHREQAREIARLFNEGQIIQDQEEEAQQQTTRKTFGQSSNSRGQSSNPRTNFIQRNLKQVLQSQSQLTEGISVNRLKDKYQPQRAELRLAQNQLLHSSHNDPTVEENYREFQQQKLQDYEKELPEEPQKAKGWGTWAGPGISEPKVDQAAQVKKKLAKIEAIKRKRRDGQMSGVIVREAYNKELKDYFVNKLPHNIKSPQQFEFLQSQPVGPEWNTLSQFKSNIRPKVVTKPGQVIQPVKLPKNLRKGKK